MDNTFSILASSFRVLLGTMEQRSKVVRVIVLTCFVLHNIMRTRGQDRTPTPADDIANEAASICT